MAGPRDGGVTEPIVPAWVLEAKSDPHRRAGRFLLGPMLGQGGMGTVHEAWDPFLRRAVAIKFLQRDSTDAIVRFLREAELQARVTHPHICPIHEVDASGALPMIVMQRLQGPTLWALRGQLTPVALAEIMEAVARAIHTAHLAQCIHRDLKPANIILEAGANGKWHPYVVDFGLARALDSNPLTCGSAVMGTPAYMSPEQIRGRTVDARTDIFALGVTFTAVLSGDAADGLSTRAEGATPPGAPPAATGPLASILACCMEERPEDRYPSAEALAEDLRRYLDGRPTRARALWAQAWRAIRRNPVLTGALVLSLAAVSTTGLYAVTVLNRARVRLDAAARYEETLKGLEGQVRHARTQPPHDIRPELARIQARLSELQAQLPALPAAARGPALFALGRGEQLLRRPGDAQRHLQQAWDEGYRAPQVAYALGTALAQVYEQDLIRLRHGQDPGIQADSDPRHAEAALGYLEQAGGQHSEAPSYPRAILAFCRRDLDEAVRMAQAAFREVPWLYEARFFEGRCQAFRFYQRHEAAGGLEAPPAPGLPEPLEQARLALLAALALAPSDEEVLAANLDLQATIAIWRSEHGQSDLASFQDGLRLARQAMVVHPDDERLRALRIAFMTRWAYAALGAGVDPRAELKAIRAEPLPGAEAPDVLSTWIATLAAQALVQAQYEWRTGLDPMPTLDWAEAQVAKASAIGHKFFPDAGDILILRAQVEVERGLDPGASLERVRQSLQREDHWTFFYPWDLQGEGLILQARHAWDAGRDPGPDLARAQEALAHSIRLAPDSVYPHCALAAALTLGAQEALRQGRDAQPLVRQAVAQAQAAMATGPNFPRCQVAMGRALTAQALQEARLGHDPGPSLARLRTVARAGMKTTPGFFPYENFLALADLMATCLGPGAPDLLYQALGHADRSLSLKPGTPETRQIIRVIHACMGQGHASGARWLLAGMPPVPAGD